MSTKNHPRSRTSGNPTSRTSNSSTAALSRQQSQPEDLRALADNVCQAVEHYSQRHPGAVATAIFFMGFYIGWKVKPW